MATKFRKNHIDLDGIKIKMDDRLFKLFDFIESHPKDWINLLQQKPYCLRIKENPNFSREFMFSYNMIESDFSQPICKVARGLIVRIPEVDPNFDNMEVIVRGFDKFHNYGESYADKIDWTKDVFVREKIDGSLIKCTYNRHDNKVHWYTNNGWDANAELPGDDFVSPYPTFQSIIDEIMKSKVLPGNHIIEDIVLLFELISPYNRIVIKYDKNDLVFLGAVHKSSGIRYTPEGFIKDVPEMSCFSTPKMYNLKNASLNEVIKIVEEFDSTHEGIVVQQGYNQLKIKGEKYLSIHKMKDNSGQLSFEHLLKCIQEETIDDIISIFPEYTSKINGVINQYKSISMDLDDFLQECKEFITNLPLNVSEKENKKTYALQFNKHPLRTTAFELWNNPENKEQIKSNYLKKLDYEKFNKVYEDLENYYD